MTLTTGEDKGLTVPVVVGGSFAKPTFGVDWRSIAKTAVKNTASKAAEKGIEKLRARRK